MMKEKILIDMSVTEKSAAALFALSRLSELSIEGISLCFGRTSIESSHRSLSGMLKLLSLDAEVALGTDMPLVRDYMIEPEKDDISQAINGLQIDTDELCRLSPDDGPDMLYRRLLEGQGQTKLLCFGCLTNIAVLLDRHPDAKELIKELIWCGGAQRHAELGVVLDYATYMDPEAASAVLKSGIRVTMCPVDLGLRSYMSREEVDRRIGEKDPVLHQYNRLMKKLWCDENAELPVGCRDHMLPLPELAAALRAACPDACHGELRYGEVDLKGRMTFGMLVIDIDNVLQHSSEEINVLQITDVDRDMLVCRLYTD